MAKARTIVEDSSVEQTIDAAIKQFPRLRELWDGWIWRLAHDPVTDAFPLPGGRLLIKSGDFRDFQLPSGIAILYSYTDDEVEIHRIRITA